MAVKSPSPGDRVPKVHTKRRVPEALSHGAVPLRSWSMGSYDTSGRSHSSIADYHGKGPQDSNHVGNCTPQFSDAFAARDRRCVQEKTPVSKRPFTQKRD